MRDTNPYSPITRIKTDTCKRCGSVSVKWVKSKRTGKWYLAFAYAGSSRDSGRVYPQTPHRCDDPNRGGFEACPDCGKHHNRLLFTGAPANHCNQH